MDHYSGSRIVQTPGPPRKYVTVYTSDRIFSVIAVLS